MIWISYFCIDLLRGATKSMKKINVEVRLIERGELICLGKIVNAMACMDYGGMKRKSI